MEKEVISDKHAISIIIIFIAGTNSIMLTATSAEKDIWIAIILATLLSLPLAYIFGRLHYLYPANNLFEITEICFGRFLGKAINIFVTLFLFDSIAQILRNATQFIVSVSFPKTPRIILDISIIIVCIWIVKSGIEVMGRWSQFFIVLFIITPIVVITLLIGKMNINNILPLFEKGIKPVLVGSFEAFMFPFTQAIAFLALISNFGSIKSSVNIFTVGFTIGGALLLILALPPLLVLGISDATELFYPTYAAISKLEILDFIQRGEIVAGAIFILGAFIKISIFLIATCRGVSHLFKMDDYRFIVLPIGLLAINLTDIEFENIMQYFNFGTNTWYYYAFPFQVIIPIVLWIAAEIKMRRTKANKLV